MTIDYSVFGYDVFGDLMVDPLTSRVFFKKDGTVLDPPLVMSHTF